jgi:hypothetical protein
MEAGAGRRRSTIARTNYHRGAMWPFRFCSFSVALLPERAEPLIAVESSTADVTQGGSQIHAPWGPSETFTVSITSACTWTIGLHGLGHD